ncbi:uncharacterized protein AAGF69_015178 isoform 1-T1 [Amazona ochrocephala]
MSPKDDFSPQKPRRPQRACAGGRGGASAILSRRSQWIRAIPPGSALPTASAARSAGSWMRGAASAASASGGTWSAGAASRSSSASPSIPSSPSSSSTGPCWAPPSLGMGDGKVQPRSFPFFPPQVQLPRLRLEPRRTGAGPRPRRSSAAPRGAVPRPRAGVRLRAQREATGAGQRHPSRVGVRGRAQLLLGGARGGAGSCSSPRASRDGDRGEGPREVSGGTREYPRVRPELKVHLGPIYPIPCSLRSYSELIPEEKVEQGPEPQEEEEEEEEEEDFAEDDDLTYTDDLRDENYHPSLDSEAEPQRRPRQSKAPKDPIKEEQPPDELSLSSSSPSEERGGRVSCKRRTRASDEDVAQIGPKRIRKAAKREILLCDFEGCGKIFSNRQYLNHHKKYQHVHQKTFTCSEPSCGKSFNFKKHLKEHEKLHSGELGGTAHPNASLPAPEPISSALQTRGITSASSAPAPSAPAATSSSTGASTPGRSRCSARCAASRAARRPPSTGTCGSTAPPPRTASPASSAARGSRRGTTWRPTRARATPPRRPPPPRGRAVAGRWRASGCGMREHPQAQGWRRLVRRSHPPWAESSAMDKGDAGSTRSREGAVLPNAIPGFSAKP